MVIWIALIVYKTGIVHQLTNSTIVANDTEALEQIIKQEVWLWCVCMGGGGGGGGGGGVPRVCTDLTVIWIALIVYTTGIVHQLTNSTIVANDTEALEQIIKQEVLLWCVCMRGGGGGGGLSRVCTDHTVIWIALIVYKTGIVHQLTNSTIVANVTEALEQIIKQEVLL